VRLARAAFTAVTLPVTEIELVPVPDEKPIPPNVPDPAGTLTVTVMFPAFTSTSETESPVIGRVVEVTTTGAVPGRALTGASLIGMTVTSRLTGSLSPPSTSVATRMIVRSPPVGLSPAASNVTDRRVAV
jgi:hypothetical protein